MSLQLTPDQEQRIRTVVDSGAYRTAEEALDAAVADVEIAANPDFDGRHEELEELLLDGFASGESIEVDEAFGNKLRAETDHWWRGVMAKTLKSKVTADEIAKKATCGEDISAHFTNKFVVVKPTQECGHDDKKGAVELHKH